MENNSEKNNIGRPFNWNKVLIPLLIIVISGASTAIINYGNRITRIETEMLIKDDLLKISERLTKLESSSGVIVESTNTVATPVENPKEKLIEIIKTVQNQYVKESYGTEAYQCFTDIDYNKFMNSSSLQKIKENLNNDNEFISLAFAVKKLTPVEWQNLKKLAYSTYKKTWGELGKVTKEGQTDDGLRAEKLIAKEIVDLLVSLRNTPDNDLEKMYK